MNHAELRRRCGVPPLRADFQRDQLFWLGHVLRVRLPPGAGAKADHRNYPKHFLNGTIDTGDFVRPRPGQDGDVIHAGHRTLLDMYDQLLRELGYKSLELVEVQARRLDGRAWSDMVEAGYTAAVENDWKEGQTRAAQGPSTSASSSSSVTPRPVFSPTSLQGAASAVAPASPPRPTPKKKSWVPSPPPPPPTAEKQKERRKAASAAFYDAKAAAAGRDRRFRPAAGTGKVDTREVRAKKRAEAQRLWEKGVEEGATEVDAFNAVLLYYRKWADLALRRRLFPPKAKAKQIRLPRAIARRNLTYYTGREQRKSTPQVRATFQYQCQFPGCGLRFETAHALQSHENMANRSRGAHTLLAAARESDQWRRRRNKLRRPH